MQGSSGSVIPEFKVQIASGGPVTVTHPDITRYFMRIPEAARLVVQAGAIGETGQVLVLDMGEPVRIVDLARDMIRLSGKDLTDIRIEFSGLRLGEKLYEELLTDNDTTLPTKILALRIARLAEQSPLIVDFLLLFEQVVANRPPKDDESIRAMLQHLPLGYVTWLLTESTVSSMNAQFVGPPPPVKTVLLKAPCSAQ